MAGAAPCANEAEYLSSRFAPIFGCAQIRLHRATNVCTRTRHVAGSDLAHLAGPGWGLTRRDSAAAERSVLLLSLTHTEADERTPMREHVHARDAVRARQTNRARLPSTTDTVRRVAAPRPRQQHTSQHTPRARRLPSPARPQRARVPLRISRPQTLRHERGERHRSATVGERKGAEGRGRMWKGAHPRDPTPGDRAGPGAAECREAPR